MWILCWFQHIQLFVWWKQNMYMLCIFPSFVQQFPKVRKILYCFFSIPLHLSRTKVRYLFKNKAQVLSTPFQSFWKGSIVQYCLKKMMLFLFCINVRGRKEIRQIVDRIIGGIILDSINNFFIFFTAKLVNSVFFSLFCWIIISVLECSELYDRTLQHNGLLKKLIFLVFFIFPFDFILWWSIHMNCFMSAVPIIQSDVTIQWVVVVTIIFCVFFIVPTSLII